MNLEKPEPNPYANLDAAGLRNVIEERWGIQVNQDDFLAFYVSDDEDLLLRRVLILETHSQIQGNAALAPEDEHKYMRDERIDQCADDKTDEG